MAKENETPEIGGFAQLNSFLQGSKPEGGISSFGDGDDVPFVENPEDIIHPKDLKPSEEDLEDEPIEENQDDDNIEPNVNEPKKKEEEDVEEEEPVDLSDYETDITSFVNNKLSEKLGWQLDGEDAPQTVEELIDFMSELVTEASKPQFANEEIAELNEFVQNGGDLKQFYSKTTSGELDLDNVDLEDSFNQRRVITENFKTLGYSEDKINRMIKRYEEAGVLEEEAQDALELLKENNEKNKEKLLESQKKFAEQQKVEQQKFESAVKDSINDLSNSLGINLSQKELKDTEDYILKVGRDGMTDFQRDMLSDVKKFVSSAYYTKNGEALPKRIKKQGESDAARNLHKKLKANKGNPGQTKGSQTGGSASEGLAKLSSLLRG